jgi:hypothetical protein
MSEKKLSTKDLRERVDSANVRAPDDPVVQGRYLGIIANVLVNMQEEQEESAMHVRVYPSPPERKILTLDEALKEASDPTTSSNASKLEIMGLYNRGYAIAAKEAKP